MLASSTRALAASSLRRVPTASRAVATATKSAVAVAAPSALDHKEDATVPLPSLSEGDLAWFEVYGVDSAQMLRDAQAEQPIALNAPHRAAAVTAASQHDIWSVVFGTTH